MFIAWFKDKNKLGKFVSQFRFFLKYLLASKSLHFFFFNSCQKESYNRVIAFLIEENFSITNENIISGLGQSSCSLQRRLATSYLFILGSCLFLTCFNVLVLKCLLRCAYMITQLLELATGSYLFHTCQVVTIVAEPEGF